MWPKTTSFRGSSPLLPPLPAHKLIIAAVIMGGQLPNSAIYRHISMNHGGST